MRHDEPGVIVMPRDHEWTVGDLARTPDDELRDELVDRGLCS